MGCFYVGYNNRRSKNGCLKIGESRRDTPGQRAAEIRRKEPFKCLGYLKLFEDTKAQRLYIESYVRAQLEKNKKLTHAQLDHFTYSCYTNNNNLIQAKEFTLLALDLAEQICKQEKIKYKKLLTQQ